jgi:hypothetical protein
MARGESGYVNAAISITTGGTYTGGGPSGYTGGSTATLNVKMRKPSVTRPRLTTTDSPTGVQEAVGGPTSVKLSLEGYFKGTAYPPSAAQSEVIKVAVTAGYALSAVILVERFEFTGDIDSAVQFAIEGETDGAYTFA